MRRLKKISDIPNRLYAIGDLHGCSLELAVTIDFLVEQESLNEKDLVVFVGDYIDRGPDSKGVIGQLVEFSKKFPSTIFLRGNHEDMLMDFLGFGGNMGEAYLLNGGRKFLESYGLLDNATLQQTLDAIPKEHIEFLKNLDSYVEVGEYVIVHAGLDPLNDLEEQQVEDLYWIREIFIANVHYFGKTIVFGHTPYQDIMYDLPYKIGIDTGLVYGNKLTVLELQNKKVLELRFGSKQVLKKDFPALDPLEREL